MEIKNLDHYQRDLTTYYGEKSLTEQNKNQTEEGALKKVDQNMQLS